MAERGRLVALAGRAGGGKSTAAAGLGGRVLKFAQPLYDMQEYIYGRIGAVYQRPDDFVKDRRLLQWLGTEWGRQTVAGDVWVRLWAAEAEAALARGEDVVCDDVRFPNEADAVHQLGGVVVEIARPGAAPLPAHASEAGLPPDRIDHRVVNDGTVDELVAKIKFVLS